MSKLPVYDITIDPEFSKGEDLGISMIAFTSKPAIIVKGVAFEQNEPKQMYYSDDSKMRIVAPVMIPMEIYRNDEDGDEYYTRFTADVIEELHAKFMRDLTNRDIFNYGHDTEKKVPAYILETWIVDSPKTDKAFTTYGIEVPKGTLMAVAQVTDKEYYESLVERGALGFSIEGYLGMKQKEEFENKNSMKLPDGEHLIEGKIYVVQDGEVIEIKDVPVEAEETVEDPKEEEMAEDPKEEEPQEEEMAEDPQEPAGVDEAKVVEIVQPMIDEVLRIVGELKSMITEKETEIEDDNKEEMKKEYSAHDRLKSFMNFNQKNRK